MTTPTIAATALIAIALASCALTLHVARKPSRPGRGGLMVSTTGLALWASGQAWLYLSSDPVVKQRVGGLLYLGVCMVAIGSAHCLSSLAGAPRLPRWGWALLSIPVVVTPVLVFTGWRDLVLADFHAPAAPGPTYSTTGPWFVVHATWAYALIIGGILVFAVVAQRAPDALRRQAHIVTLALGLPLLVNLAFISGLVSTGRYDPTPISMLVTLGALVWGLERARLIDGQIGMVTVARDLVVEAMRDPVLTLGVGGTVLDMNPAAQKLLRVEDVASGLGTPVTAFIPLWPDRTGARDGDWQATFGHEQRTYDVAVTELPGPSDQSVQIAVLRDSTQRETAERTSRQQEAVQRHRATHDDLTGLANRTSLFEHLASSLSADPSTDRACALLILDLGGFKALNDSFGHRAGDDVLRELSGRFRTVAGERNLVARIGGDEFAVVVDGGDQAAALSMAQRISEATRVPFRIGSAEIRLVGSVGVAIAPGHGSDPDTLMHAADVAMYDAKREGRAVAVYTETQGLREPGRLLLGAELREALRGDQIQVHYQPQIGAGGVVVGMEALVRWAHPRLGLLTPDRFLPLAEESALMCDLTDVVLRQALAAANTWGDAGRDLRMSVNISERDLRDPRLAQRVMGALISGGVAPDRLTLEVTENALLTGRDSIAQLQRLRGEGVRVSLDDFGTGFAPLATLRTTPVDELKIDRTFVSGMTERDHALVKSLLSLGHDLGMVVVAEGVESDRERRALEALACDVLQGYFFGTPKPASQFGAGAPSAPSAAGDTDLARPA